MKQILLRNHQAVGDIVTLSALPKAIHAAYPGQYEIYVSTAHSEVWFYNPHVTLVKISPNAEIDGVTTINMRYPGIATSNRLPMHYIEAWMRWFSVHEKVDVRPIEFRGDMYLSDLEKEWPEDLLNGVIEEGKKFWLLISGGKNDFTAKWYPFEHYQKLIDLMGWSLGQNVKVMQIGHASHHQPRLRGALDLIGRTTIRDIARLLYWCEGTISPVTFLPHMSAAVPMRRERYIAPDEKPDISENRLGGPRLRPSIVLSGGREPRVWEAYPGHRFLENVGALNCCSHGACWRDRCQLVGDGDAKDSSRTCLNPVLFGSIYHPKCLAMISPEEVMENIMSFYRGGVLSIQ